MLDVARHFFGVDDVLRFIDLAALYKLNVLHLHLTDDQGWRLADRRLAGLTVVRRRDPGRRRRRAASTRTPTTRGSSPTRRPTGSPWSRRSTCPATSTPRWSPIPSWVAASGPSRTRPGARRGMSLDVGSRDRAALPRRRDRRAGRGHARRLHPPRRRRGRGHGPRGLRAVHVGRVLAGAAPRQDARSCGRRPAWRSCPRARSSSTGPTPRPREQPSEQRPAADPDVPGAAHLPGPEVRRDDRARADLGGRRRGPRRLRVGPVRGHRGRATSSASRPPCGRRRPRPGRRRAHGLPAPGRGGRGRLVAGHTTGRTSARAWPPTARCSTRSA